MLSHEPAEWSAWKRVAIHRVAYHLDKLAVLNHHRVDDAEEGLVTWEETSSSGKGITLKHALASVLRQKLNDTSALRARSDIPLEVTAAISKDGVKLVRDELVGREDTESCWVPMNRC